MKISVIIPHYNGKEILAACLDSLLQNNFSDYEILMVDNGSTDGSVEFVKQKYPVVRVIESKKNLGYAGGCNLGIQNAKGSFVLLLNNDVEVAQNFLQEIYKEITRDEKIALVQPKILSIQNKEYFDYSGAAGGEIDIFGHPFARGRVFIDVEKDNKQYDSENKEIFWASGTACLIRKSVLDQIGLLDQDFFAHMEEIDLNWRAQLAGYKVTVTTKTHIFHYSGFTLSPDNPQKMYLNHRNNLIMLIKNYSFSSLLWILPIRMLLELGALIYALLRGNTAWAAGVAKGIMFVKLNFRTMIKKHKKVQKLRVITDREIRENMYNGSIALAFFLFKKSSADICAFRKTK